MRYKIFAPLFLLLFAVCAAQVPYDRNQLQGMDPTASNGYAIGNIQDASQPTVKRQGIPTTPIVTQFFDAPEAADDDHFATATKLSATVCAATGDKTDLLAARYNDVNSATGQYFCRNLTVIPSGATTGTLTLVYWDAQNRERTVAITWTNSSSTYTSKFTCRGLKSVNVTSAFSDSRTLKIGNATVFGLDYPMYTTTAVNTVKLNAAGTAFPASDDTETWVEGTVSTDAADAAADTTNAQPDLNGTVVFSSAPDGTKDYYIIYVPNIWYRPAPNNASGYPKTAWSQLR